MEETENTKSAWREFCEETGIGFQHVLPESRSSFCRCCWLVVLLVCSALTICALINQIQQFIDNPILINVNKKYPTSMSFPTVLLCNTQKWRVSQVRPDATMHRILNDLYATPVLNATTSFLPDNNATLSSLPYPSRYFKMVGMDLETLVAGCKWKQDNRLCNITRDFQEVLTLWGYCYAFNVNSSRPFTATSAGSKKGLTLLLNAEAYEAMNGPYNTFGVTVSFLPIGQNIHSATDAVQVLVGSSTSIAIKYSEVTYIKGKTCDTIPLKYSKTYRRAACKVDFLFDYIIHNCSCIPYMLNETYVNETGLPFCDMARHFQCVQPLIDKPPPEASSEHLAHTSCPLDCQTFEYSPAISQAEVAWNQIRADQIATNGLDINQLETKLLKARETAKRYLPENILLHDQLFDAQRKSTNQLLAVMQQANSLKCQLPVTPSGEQGPNVYTQTTVDNVALIYYPTIKSCTQRLFSNLKDSLHTMQEFMTNGTYVDSLFEHTAVGGNDGSLPKNVLGGVQVLTLQNWIKAWQAFEIGSCNSGSTTVTVESFNNSFYASSHDTILRPNDTAFLNAQLDVLNSMRLDFKNAQSCWNVLAPMPFLTSNPNALNVTLTNVLHDSTVASTNNSMPMYLLDMLTCLQVNYTSDSTLWALSKLLQPIVSFLGNIIDAPTQKAMCKKYLCANLNTETAPSNCTLNSQQWTYALNLSLVWITKMVASCNKTTEKALDNLDFFINYYSKFLYAEYVSTLSTMTDFLQNIQTVSDYLSVKPWNIDSNFDWLLNNMSSYDAVNLTYRAFSTNVQSTFAPWAAQTIRFKVNNVRIGLQDLQDTLNILKSDIVKLRPGNAMELSDTSDSSKGFRFHDMYKVISVYLLQWTNDMYSKLNTVDDCVATLTDQISPLLHRIANSSITFQNTMSALSKDTSSYLESLVPDNNLLRKNFMLVDIYYRELSEKLTNQAEAVTFWSLISNLGGAIGLFLGTSILTVIQVVDILIRHCMRHCRRACHFLHKKRKAVTAQRLTRNETLTQIHDRNSSTIELINVKGREDHDEEDLYSSQVNIEENTPKYDVAAQRPEIRIGNDIFIMRL